MPRSNSRGELIVQASSVNIAHETANITTDSIGEVEDISQDNFSKFCIQVLRTTGSNAFAVDLEGSLGPDNFQVLATSSGSTGALVFVPDVPVEHIRYRVTTIGVGNTLTVRFFGV